MVKYLGKNAENSPEMIITLKKIAINALLFGVYNWQCNQR
jgi:hypothetical protein